MDISVEANVGGGGVISLRTEQDICRVAQTCEIEVEGVATCSYWDELAVSINGTPRLAGYVEEVIIHSDGSSTVRGIDKMKRAIDMFIDEEVEVTEEKDAGWWIAYWLDVAGVPNSGSVETGRTIPGDISWQYQFVSDIILECLGYAGGGYVVIVDSSGIAQIQEKTIGASGHTLNPIKFSRTQDDNWYRDRAVVFGTTSGAWVDDEWVPGEVTIVAEAGSGDRTAVLSSIYVQSQASAEDLADEILAFFDEYLDVKRCLIEGDESIWLGDAASINCFGYNGTGLVTSIETTVDDSGFRQLVSLDEKCGFIWGWGVGFLRLAYHHWPNDELKYAYLDTSGGWQFETVDSGEDIGWACSLAIGSDGYAHISYNDLVNDILKYAYQDASGWHIETADSGDGGNVGSYCAIALDSNDYPHISYRRSDSPNRALKYAYKDTEGWHIEVMELADTYDNSIVVGVDDYPHISYYKGYPDYSLKYAYKDVSGWHTETVDPDPNPPYAPGVGRGNSIALDSNGYPHISYDDEGNDGLKYAYQDAGGWNIETIRAGDKNGAGTSLVLDSDDNAHIAYFWDWDLTYTYKDSGSWNHENTGEPDGSVGVGVSLALDNNGYPHISYQHRGWPISYYLKYAYKDGDGWHVETVDDTEDVGFAHSLAWG